MSSPHNFTMGQLVEVASRTWAGINKPGGIGNITGIHYSEGFISQVDVKYIIQGGTETNIDLDFVKPHEYLGRRARSRTHITNIGSSPKKKRRTTTTTCQSTTMTAETKKRATTKNKEEDENDPPPLCEAPAPTEATFPVPCAIEIRTNAPHLPEISPLAIDRSVASIPVPIPSSKSTKLAPRARKNTNTTVVSLEASKNAAAKNEPTTTVSQLYNKKKAPKKKTDSTAKPPAAKKALKTSLAKATTSGVAFKDDGDKKPQAMQMIQKEKPMPKKPPAKTQLQPKKLLPPAEPVLAPRADKTEPVVGTRVPLQKVYDNKMASAKEFVHELVKEKTTKKLVVKPKECAISTMDPARRQTIMGIFSALMGRKDGEFGASLVLGEMNTMLDARQEPFTKEEVDSLLKLMCAEEKIMVSEGVVYSLF